MNKHPEKLIFSVHADDRSEYANRMALENAKAALVNNAIPFIEAEGCYKGQKERNIVAIVNSRSITACRLIAAGNNQESVLYVDSDGMAQLQTPAGRALANLGLLQQVSEVKALAADGYTKIGNDYWICTGRYWCKGQA